MKSRIITADCLFALTVAPAASVDAIVTDPPYGLGFMGKQWDDLPPGVEWARECLRVLKPGGHLLAFGGTRTSHRLVCAIEDAGFEIRDSLVWLYGSGFPKSHNVSKAIDKAARGVPQGGADPTSVNHGRFKTQATEGKRHVSDDGRGYGAGPGQFMAEAGEVDDRVLVQAAQPWEGWGTALKPAHEPIVLARKPLIGTVARNVLALGTGALNVDGCRIGTGADRTAGGPRPNRTSAPEWRMSDGGERPEGGRWPANVLLDPEAAAMLDAAAPNTGGGGFCGGRTFAGDVYGAPAKAPPTRQTGRVDRNGGASRFFYCAKASSKERNAGLEGFARKAAGVHDDDGYVWPLNGDGTPRGKKVAPRANVHPTVKPVALMRWLVRLVTPPGGLVLDPFAGSGTTGIACGLEGLRFIGIEQSPEYAEIARARLAWWAQP